MERTLLFLLFMCVGAVWCQDSTKVWVTSSSYTSYCMTAFLNATFEEDGDLQTDYGENGKYGECLEMDSFGLLVHVTATARPAGPDSELVVDHTGCKLPLRSSVGVGGQLPTEPWIALIKRGSCNFEVKVENAFVSNASAVIVYDDKPSNSLQKMKLSSMTRNMSAVFTYKATGDRLAALVDSGTPVYMAITVGNPCDRPYNLNRTSVMFVSISFIVLMIISLAWLVFYYVQRFRYIHAKDRMSRRLGTAAKKALSKIPTKNVKSEDKEMQGEGECCAVCIEPFKVSETLRVLPCRHEFHKSCIDPWLLEHRTCPMCKMDILKHYGFVFTGSQESILQVDEESGGGSREGEVQAASPTPLTAEPVVAVAADTPTTHQGTLQRSPTDNDIESTARCSVKHETTDELDTRLDVTTKDCSAKHESTDETNTRHDTDLAKD